MSSYVDKYPALSKILCCLDVGAYVNDIGELRAPGFERHKKNSDYQQLKLQAAQGWKQY